MMKFYPIPSELNRIELEAKQLQMNAKIVAAKKVKAGWKDARCANWFRFNDQAPQIWQELSDEHNARPSPNPSTSYRNPKNMQQSKNQS